MNKVEEVGRFEWTVEDIRNPESTKPSSTFVDITLYNDKGVPVASYTKHTRSILNVYSSYIQKFNLEQTVLEYNALSKFTISFLPNSAIPKEGTIQITWPQQIELTNDFACSIRTNRFFTPRVFRNVGNFESQDMLDTKN